MKEKYSERLAKKKNLQPRPDELDVRITEDAFSWRRESAVVECQVVWPGRVTEAGSDLTNVFPFIALLSTTVPLRPPQPPKPPQKNFTVMSFICKTGVLFSGWMCVHASVSESVCVCVCVCMCCLSGWFHYLKDHYTCLSTAKRPEKN